MNADLTPFLHALKLGTITNVAFLIHALSIPADRRDPLLVIPGAILFAVSAWRCCLPNRYEGNVVLHDTVLSSAFVTRVLATFSEVAYVSFFAVALMRLDPTGRPGVQAIAIFMVAAATISQGFVWTAILTDRYRLYVYEEIGWLVLFAGHTVGAGWLFFDDPTDAGTRSLLVLALVFGAGYLPWQLFHLRFLVREAREQERDPAPGGGDTSISQRVRATLFVRERATSSEAWGGIIGVTWMAAYWVLVIPVWMHVILRVLSAP
ncbi:MAG: hypothetical protein NXI30_22440 [bacterium]|nr:hypothetical protein [bacterium]